MRIKVTNLIIFATKCLNTLINAPTTTSNSNLTVNSDARSVLDEASESQNKRITVKKNIWTIPFHFSDQPQPVRQSQRRSRIAKQKIVWKVNGFDLRNRLKNETGMLVENRGIIKRPVHHQSSSKYLKLCSTSMVPPKYLKTLGHLFEPGTDHFAKF